MKLLSYMLGAILLGVCLWYVLLNFQDSLKWSWGYYVYGKKYFIEKFILTRICLEDRSMSSTKITNPLPPQKQTKKPLKILKSILTMSLFPSIVILSFSC